MNDDDKIPEERAALYYIGGGLMIIGLLMFFSLFFTGMSPPQGNFGSPPPEFLRAIFGMGLMFVGGICQGIGKAGLAGSGVVLDPKRQREEMKPWSRMAGGMMNDALEQVDVVKSVSASGREVVKVRCPACRTLNDEDAKFCDECGKPL
jgi:hypothetical protein